MNEPWFRPKKFGYGVTPIHWKGWVSSFVLVFAMLSVVRFMILSVPGGSARPLWEMLFGAAICVGLLAGFSWFARGKTAGDWRWRWGRRD